MMKLFNTYTKTIENFQPLDPAGRTVRMYSCGPTVYSYAHIGNFRSFLLGDLLRRTLERRGYVVEHVMNITDVGHMTQDHLADATGEDKMSRAARELGWDPFRVAEHFETAFANDAALLRLRNYSGDEAKDRGRHPRATDHIPEMLVLIQLLIEREYAYVDSSGQVYYSIPRFPDYGRLSGKVIDDLQAGARVDVRDEKRDPRDFALWKVDDKHLMRWDPHSESGWRGNEYERYRELLPTGVDPRIKAGFPGWHIECSAMSRAHLGDIMDIHTGGEDNIFPHHECEIAQTCGALGVTVPAPDNPDEQRTTFSRFWVHGRHLLVESRKMSKSAGTLFTARELFDPIAAGRPDLAEELEAAGFTAGRVPPVVLRYALMCAHFSQPMNFTFELLAQARASVDRIQRAYDQLREISGDSATTTANIDFVEERRTAFDAALADNLNISAALSEVFAFVREVNTRQLTASEAASAATLMEEFDAVLDVLPRGPRTRLIPAQDLVEMSTQLKSRHGAAVERWLNDPALAGVLASDEYALTGITDVTPDAAEMLLAIRQLARNTRNYSLADRVRDVFRDQGFVVEDTSQGVRYTRK